MHVYVYREERLCAELYVVSMLFWIDYCSTRTQSAVRGVYGLPLVEMLFTFLLEKIASINIMYFVYQVYLDILSAHTLHLYGRLN